MTSQEKQLFLAVLQKIAEEECREDVGNMLGGKIDGGIREIGEAKVEQKVVLVIADAKSEKGFTIEVSEVTGGVQNKDLPFVTTQSGFNVKILPLDYPCLFFLSSGTE